MNASKSGSSTYTQPQTRIMPTAAALDRRDVLAVALILASFAAAVVIMPPGRSFAFDDDWDYARAAERIVAGEGFRPTHAAQVTLVAHAYWGALFGKLLGMSFTTLNISMLVMSFIGALAFYVLLRRIGFAPGLSGLGVAMLGLNPYFIRSSYSFMTEATFLTLLLLSCLCYYEALHRESTTWLWAGSLFVALSFLVRQFGLAPAFAVLVWLLWARTLTLPKAAAILLLPVITVAGYYVWSSSHGPTLGTSIVQQELVNMFTSVGGWVQRFKSLSFALPLAAMTMPLFVRSRYWKWALVPVVAYAVAVYIQGDRRFTPNTSGERLAQPFSTIQPYKLEYSPVWWLAAGLTVWLALLLLERSWPAVKALVKSRAKPAPVVFVCLLGLVLFAGMFVTKTEFFVRYMLPIAPFIIVAGLQILKDRPRRDLIPVVLALAVVGISGIALHQDDYAFLTARWNAGHELVAQGVPYEKIDNGYMWDAYYLYEKGLARFPVNVPQQLGGTTIPEKVIDPEYVIDINQHPGYRVQKTLTYFSWLNGMTTHELFVLQREPAPVPASE